MSEEIALVDEAVVARAIPPEAQIVTAMKLAKTLAWTEFVPGALRGKPEAVLACILTGRELGIGPMQSLQQIHVIDGKPGVSPELMRAMILRAGHRIEFGDLSDRAATITGTRADDRSTATVTWTLEDAERAGLCQIKDGKPWSRSKTGKRLPWETYTRAMLVARATSELGRLLFADVVAGFGYTPEELGSLDDAPAPTQAPEEEDVAEAEIVGVEGAAEAAATEPSTPESPCGVCGADIDAGEPHDPVCEAKEL